MDIVQRLEIENDCRRLTILYCHHIDHLNPQAFADLFTEDAVYKPAIEPEPIVGHAAILRWINRYPKDRLGRHMSTNQLVEIIDEDHAVGTSYAVVFREEHPVEGEISTNSTPRSFAEYVDTYRRTDDGWRIASRVYRVNFLEKDAPVRMKTWPEFPTSIGSLQL